MKTNSITKLNIDMETLITKLKTEDARTLKYAKQFQQLILGILTVFIIILIVNPGSVLTLSDYFSWMFTALALISFILIFKKSQHDYHAINYTLPTIELLKKAADRYKLFTRKSALVIIPILFMSVALPFTFSTQFQALGNAKRVILIEIIYIVIMVFAMALGMLIWYKQQKPLRENALYLIKDIES